MTQKFCDYCKKKYEMSSEDIYCPDCGHCSNSTTEDIVSKLQDAVSTPVVIGLVLGFWYFNYKWITSFLSDFTIYAEGISFVFAAPLLTLLIVGLTAKLTSKTIIHSIHKDEVGSQAEKVKDK